MAAGITTVSILGLCFNGNSLTELRWLLAHNQETKATEILACLENKSADDSFVTTQCKEIQYSIQYELEHKVKWKDLLRGKGGGGTHTTRRLLLGAGTQAMQQFGGINIVSYYLPTVLIESVGLSNTTARLLTACNAVSYLLFAGIAVQLIERWGRRGLMLLSTSGQLLSFLAITILLRYSAASDAESPKTASASIAFFFFYFISFGIGMLGVPWLYPTEINSLPMRAKGAAVATATNWITNFVIVEITPIGIQNLGWQFYIVWTVFNAFFLPVIYFIYPETGES